MLPSSHPAPTPTIGCSCGALLNPSAVAAWGPQKLALQTAHALVLALGGVGSRSR